MNTYTEDTLYFGTNTPNGRVSHSDWDKFMAREITPRLPGFTEWFGLGHWKGKEERTHIVKILHDRGNEPESEKAIAEIVEAYKRIFQQESVLRTSSKVEAQF